MSQEYLGDPITFTPIQEEGSNITSSSNSVATLTRNYLDNGVQILESTLCIVASLNHLNSTVTCVHTDSGNTDQFIVQVVGKSFNHN